jgi:predicted phosphoribosyltransferase
MSLFLNRVDAGRRLATALAGYKNQHPVVLALPRGGVPVAAEVATALGAPLDLILVRKIGVPAQPELAMGAVVDGSAPIIVRNDDVIWQAGITAEAFDAVCEQQITELERRRQLYMKERRPVEIAERVALVMDDGIATGATMRAALRAMRQRRPRELVLAVPVAPAETIADLRHEVDALICLETPKLFGAIGYFYDDFRQLDDADVIEILSRFPRQQPSHAA